MKKITCIAILFLLAGCGPDGLGINPQNCPAYDRSFFTAWFPYSTGQTIYFSGSNGSRDTLAIDSVDHSTSYQVYQKADGSYQSCNTQGKIYTFDIYNDNRPGKASLNIRHDISGSLGKDIASIGYKRCAVSVKVLDAEVVYIAWSDSSDHTMEKASTITLNGKTFNDVIIFSTKKTTTATYEGMDRLYIARGIGIAGYRSYPGGDVYARD